MLPGKYVLPLVAPEDMDMQPPKGVLFVTLIAATDVRARATRPGGFALFLLLVLLVPCWQPVRADFTRPGAPAVAHACEAASKQLSPVCGRFLSSRLCIVINCLCLISWLC